MSNVEFSDDIRARLATVSHQAKADPDFMQQLSANPIGVLTGAGVPEPDVRQLLATAIDADAGDVSGYAMARCTGPTCRWTLCPATCFPLTTAW